MIRFFSALAMVVIASIVALLAAELVLRAAPSAWFDDLETGDWRPHLTRGFEMAPNQSKTRWGGLDWNINSRGFRDRERSLDKAGFRILGLGDSYLVGNEVSFEHTFLHRLEKRLGVEVVNLAVGAYGTIQERLLFQERGRAYDADIVILGVTLQNDLNDNAKFPYKYCVEAGVLVSCRYDFSKPEVRLALELARRSLLARLVLREFRRYLLPAKDANKAKGAKPRNPAGDSKNSPIRYGRAIAGLYRRDWHASVQRGFELLKENILTLRQDVEDEGARLVVVIIPLESQIYDWQWDQYVERAKLDAAQYDSSKPVGLLVEFLNVEIIRHVNLLPHLREAAKTDPNLHPGHWHWSVAANRLAADVVGEYLTQHFAIPSPPSDR